MSGFELRVSNFGSRTSGLESWVANFGFQIPGFEFRVSNFGFGVWSAPVGVRGVEVSEELRGEVAAAGNVACRGGSAQPRKVDVRLR